MLTSYAGSGIFGESYGTGVPCVLALHGWRRAHGDFTAALTVPDGLAAIAVDLPGFGATPPPDEVWGSPEYARALGPILDSMASGVIVVGHSFGARVAVHLANQRPERVAGLVLTGAPLYRASERTVKAPLQFRVVKRLAKSRLVPEATLEKYRQKYGSADYRAATGIVRDILVKSIGETYSEALAGVECPVELVWGEKDTAAPVVVAEKIKAALPKGANLVVLPGIDHMTPLKSAADIRAAVDRLRG